MFFHIFKNRRLKAVFFVKRKSFWSTKSRLKNQDFFLYGNASASRLSSIS